MVPVVTLEAVVKNATSAAKLDTSRAIAPKEEALEAATGPQAVMEVGMLVDAKDRPATHVVDTDICLETALRVKSATTVSPDSERTLKGN